MRKAVSPALMVRPRWPTFLVRPEAAAAARSPPASSLAIFSANITDSEPERM